jgi:hypothetical protein
MFFGTFGDTTCQAAQAFLPPRVGSPAPAWRLAKALMLCSLLIAAFNTLFGTLAAKFALPLFSGSNRGGRHGRHGAASVLAADGAALQEHGHGGHSAHVAAEPLPLRLVRLHPRRRAGALLAPFVRMLAKACKAIAPQASYVCLNVYVCLADNSVTLRMLLLSPLFSQGFSC